MNEEDDPLQPQEIFNLQLNFSLALSLTKICSQRCSLFNLNTITLDQTKIECVKKCAESIQMNYKPFLNQVTTSMNFDEENEE